MYTSLKQKIMTVLTKETFSSFFHSLLVLITSSNNLNCDVSIKLRPYGGSISMKTYFPLFHLLTYLLTNLLFTYLKTCLLKFFTCFLTSLLTDLLTYKST